MPEEPRLARSLKLVLKWDRPTKGSALNWRQRSRLAEVWLINVKSNPFTVRFRCRVPK